MNLHSNGSRENVGWFFIPVIIMAAVLAIIQFSGINQNLFLAMNRFFSVLPDPVWSAITLFGDGLIIAVLFFPFIRKRPDVMLVAVLAMLLMTLAVNMSKDFFHVARPPKILDPAIFYIIGPAHKSRAFPSGHTATIFCFAGVWIFSGIKSSIKILLLLFALLVGFSRIAVGVHWPADVAAGAMVGWVTAFIGVQLARLFKKPIPFLHIFLGILLAAATVYWFFYDTQYPQAIGLQVTIGLVCMIIGMIELLKLILSLNKSSG